MTVKELIEKLQEFDKDLEIVCLNSQEDLDEPNPKKEKMVKRSNLYYVEFYSSLKLYESDVIMDVIVL